MTRITKNAVESNDFARFSLSGLLNKVLTFFMRKETYTYEEVFGGIKCDHLTLEESLRYLEISESEFRELLESSDYPTPVKFDKQQKFPTELILSFDTGNWMED